jgi:outer membrane protein assembly factor BamD (BamD/ComL family)
LTSGAALLVLATTAQPQLVLTSSDSFRDAANKTIVVLNKTADKNVALAAVQEFDRFMHGIPVARFAAETKDHVALLKQMHNALASNNQIKQAYGGKRSTHAALDRLETEIGRLENEYKK